MIRRGLIAVALLAVGALAAGCGDEGAAAPPPVTPTGLTAAATVTAPTQPEAPPANTASAPAEDVVIGWAGDMVPASSDIALPDDPDSLLAGVRPLLTSPDLMIVNLEGTLTDGGSSKCGASSTDCFAFRSPPSYARAFRRAGIDLLNLANNHAYDFGAAGYADTRRALRRAGLGVTGGPDDITVVERDGVRIAVVGFAPYAWAAPLTDLDAVARLVRSAADRADIVVVAFHGGAEGTAAAHVPAGAETYLGEQRGDLRAFGRAAIRAGADLVVGSGPHVVRGVEFYRGRLIAYSAGNFVGYGGVFGLAGDTAISYVLHVRLRADGAFVSARIHPTLLTGSGIAERDPARRAIGLVRSLTRADFFETGARIAGNGAIGRRT